MKILHTAAGLSPDSGGPARSVPQLARALAAAGHEIALWAPRPVDHLSDSDPEGDTGLAVHSGSFDAALEAFGRPDLVHDHGIWLPCHRTVAGICEARGIQRMVSPRGMLEPWSLNHKKWKKRVAWWLYQRKALRSAVALHATAASEAAQFRKLGLAQPILLAANGVDEAPAPDTEPDGVSTRRAALFLSRIHPKKGLPILLEAWARIRPREWGLCITGPEENNHLAELKTLCDRLALDWRDVSATPQTATLVPPATITFSPAVEGNAKWQAFHAAELFILPTHSENFGIVVAEALAAGLPVITTHGAPWEILEKEDCGWWVPVNIDAIATALADATRHHPDELAAMGARGRQIVAEHFSWDTIARDMIAGYEWLLGQGPKPKCIL